jgi:DNA-binding MarR family transcriptional regulator/RimJ/RimL family protein N-acetyltransferase
MDPALIRKVRSFNRTVTQTIGVLHEDYLGRDRPLGESRLLFEIGENGAMVSYLRDRLDLDSGYVSRLLRSLEKQELVTTETSLEDRRVRVARLTPAGAAELNSLNSDSDRLAQSILDPLNDDQRNKLTAAMVEVERLLSASSVRAEEVAPNSHEAEHCLSHYFAELAERFDSGFDPAQSLAPTLDDFAPPRGTFLVMRLHGELVGCGGFKRDAVGAAYIKRMWVSRDARGRGLGRRLLRELETRAKNLGYRTIRLETQKSLKEAQYLYRSSGYREVPPFNDELYAHHWFEKTLD